MYIKSIVSTQLSFVQLEFLILSLNYLSKPKCANQSRIFIVSTLFNVYFFVIKCNRHTVYYTITHCNNKLRPNCIQWVLYTYTYVSIYIYRLKRISIHIHGCNEINAYKLDWNMGEEVDVKLVIQR